MKSNLIITISREFGSGGHEIGAKLAEKLSVPLYDKEIIDKAAEQTGLSAEYIAEHEQRYTSSLMFNLAMGNYSRTGELPLHDQIDIVQSEIIRNYAKEGSCVIVGRCADYVLEDDFECLNVFIYAPDEVKLERITERYSGDARTAAKLIKETNRMRSKHYNYFTGKIWGDRQNYDLMLNSGRLGIDGCVEMIIQAAEKVD
ncbi:MAG: cytidylate kinase-like family protein [Clostridia bacterium]|nr:cytidylate kinase-like family protein [Clostridia bacterium]